MIVPITDLASAVAIVSTGVPGPLKVTVISQGMTEWLLYSNSGITSKRATNRNQFLFILWNAYPSTNLYSKVYEK